jgi:hypothetical protein
LIFLFKKLFYYKIWVIYFLVKIKLDIIKLFFIKLINEVYPIETEELNNIEYCKNGVDTYDYIKEMQDNCLRAMELKG